MSVFLSSYRPEVPGCVCEICIHNTGVVFFQGLQLDIFRKEGLLALLLGMGLTVLPLPSVFPVLQCNFIYCHQPCCIFHTCACVSVQSFCKQVFWPCTVSPGLSDDVCHTAHWTVSLYSSCFEAVKWCSSFILALLFFGRGHISHAKTFLGVVMATVLYWRLCY
jgi:hypothetical protein